jgi:hypothetical protein
MVTKDELKKLLKERVLTIKFKKKDETVRKMTCTLANDYLPENKEEQIDKKTKAENPNVLPVWDLEKLAWRSFRIDSVVEYETNW